MVLVLFDFDGTITKKDSLSDFIKYAVGNHRFYLLLLPLIPTITAYKLRLIPNYQAKERLISHYFKEWRYSDFQKISDKYSTNQIDKITRPKAIEKIAWHQKQGHKIVIVSASIENWLKKWCDQKNIELIATQLEIKDGKVTGKFSTKNCYGIEKVKRVKERYNLSEYSDIYAYGDSLGDKEMLGIANKQFYKYFS